MAAGILGGVGGKTITLTGSIFLDGSWCYDGRLLQDQFGYIVRTASYDKTWAKPEIQKGIRCVPVCRFHKRTTVAATGREEYKIERHTISEFCMLRLRQQNLPWRYRTPENIWPTRNLRGRNCFTHLKLKFYSPVLKSIEKACVVNCIEALEHLLGRT